MDTSVIQPSTDTAVGSWCNSYTVPTTLNVLPTDELYGPTPYDVNFCYPYLAQTLEHPQLKLIPFVPRVHAEAFFLHCREHPEDFKHMRFPVPNTLEEMLTWFEYNIRRNPENIVFALMFADEHRQSWSYGGILSLTHGEPERFFAEISMGIGFRSHTGRNGAALATALLARYCMNSATDSPPGLGLRKIGWTCHGGNYAAQGLARMLGLRVESMQRWNRLAPPGKENNKRSLRKSDPSDVPGIDDYFLVMCFDDWEAEGRKIVEATLARTFTDRKKEGRAAKL